VVLLHDILLKRDLFQVLGMKGIVNKVDDDGDVLVECINSTKYVNNNLRRF